MALGAWLGMSATVTLEQDRLLSDLLKCGRFRNKSEIIRRGLELVRAEVEREDLAPLTAEEQAAEYAKMTPEELVEDRMFGQASYQPKKGDLE